MGKVQCPTCGSAVPTYYLNAAGCWDCRTPGDRLSINRANVQSTEVLISKLERATLFQIRDRFPDPYLKLIREMPDPMIETLYAMHRLEVAQKQIAELRHVSPAAVTRQLDRLADRFTRAGLPAPVWPRHPARPLSHRELVELWLCPV